MIRELFVSPFFLLLLLIGCFELCMVLRARFRSQWINPTLITTIVVICVLKTLNIEWQTFDKASSYLTFWLAPAVVCLAVPLYIEWQKIRSQWLAIFVSQLVGSFVGIVSGVWLVGILVVATYCKLPLLPNQLPCQLPLRLPINYKVLLELHPLRC